MESDTVHVRDNEENVISLGGIFDFLLKKWKVIILISLVGLGVGFAYSYVKYNKLLKVERTALNMDNVNLQKFETFDEYGEQIKFIEGNMNSYDDKEKLQAISMINNLKSSKSNIISGLNADEKVYYEKAYLGKTPKEPEAPAISYKYVALLFILALFLICFIYVMKYIFNHQIKTATELEEMFGLHVFGVYKASSDKKGLDGVLQRREAKKDLVENSQEYIVTSVKELNKMPAILVGNKNNEVVTNFMGDLTKLCSDLSSYGELQYDADAISVAHKQNGVIFIVNLWNTTVEELDREIEIAIAQNINVLGCIVVK